MFSDKEIIIKLNKNVRNTVGLGKKNSYKMQ